MDYDVNNQAMLQAGAVAREEMRQTQDWQPISSAPRDGTVIELRNTYGVAPWYAIARWTDERTSLNRRTGKRTPYKSSEPEWVILAPNAGNGAIESRDLMWRPYNGDIGNYVDPTGGAQQSMAYWRGAAAVSVGKAPDYFEKETARNVAKSELPEKRGFWGWLFGE